MEESERMKQLNGVDEHHPHIVE